MQGAARANLRIGDCIGEQRRMLHLPVSQASPQLEKASVLQASSAGKEVAWNFGL